MASKHTPGPWEIDKEYPRRIQMEGTPENAPQTGAIAEVAKAYWKEGVMEANAQLIAAAPDLLEACKEGLAECERSKHAGGDIVGLIERIELIEAAIAKAENR